MHMSLTLVQVNNKVIKSRKENYKINKKYTIIAYLLVKINSHKIEQYRFCIVDAYHLWGASSVRGSVGSETPAPV